MKINENHWFSLFFNGFQCFFNDFHCFSMVFIVFNGFQWFFNGFHRFFNGFHWWGACGRHARGGVRAAGTHRRLCRVPGESAWMSSPCVNPWTANAGLICPWSDRLLKLQEPTEVKRHRARLVLGWGPACRQLFPAHLPSYRMSPDPPP